MSTKKKKKYSHCCPCHKEDKQPVKQPGTPIMALCCLKQKKGKRVPKPQKSPHNTMGVAQ
eukprot:3457738-Amphidinium_carterae.1